MLIDVYAQRVWRCDCGHHYRGVDALSRFHDCKLGRPRAHLWMRRCVVAIPLGQPGNSLQEHGELMALVREMGGSTDHFTDSLEKPTWREIAPVLESAKDFYTRRG